MVRLISTAVSGSLLFPKNPKDFIKDSELIEEIRKAFNEKESFPDWYAELSPANRREVNNQIMWLASQGDSSNVADAFHFSMALFRADSESSIPKRLLKFVCLKTIACPYLSDQTIAEAKSALKSLEGGQIAELEFTTKRRRN
jgi:hypothetical protein